MITIQRAAISDAALIADIGAKSFIESHGNSAPAGDIESYVSTTYDLKIAEEELNNPENIFHLIYYKNRAAGFSKIIFNSPYALIESSAVTKLERIYLLKEFYDLKLGLALLNYLTALSKKENQIGMWLFVWTQNQRAVSFYKKYGFNVIADTHFKISETHSNPNHIMYLNY